MTGQLLGTMLAISLVGTGITLTSAAYDDVLTEATQVASALQQHELETALEVYYLKMGQYPRVSAKELGPTLYAAGVLKETELPVAIEYQVSNNGQSYELMVK